MLNKFKKFTEEYARTSTAMQSSGLDAVITMTGHKDIKLTDHDISGFRLKTSIPLMTLLE